MKSDMILVCIQYIEVLKNHSFLFSVRKQRKSHKKNPFVYKVSYSMVLSVVTCGEKVVFTFISIVSWVFGNILLENALTTSEKYTGKLPACFSTIFFCICRLDVVFSTSKKLKIKIYKVVLYGCEDRLVGLVVTMSYYW